MTSARQTAERGNQNGKDVRTVDFVGIGTAKGGTTWMSECLDEHPAICMSEPKEVYYFNETSIRHKHEDGMNPHFKEPLEWYAKRFAHCAADSLKGEFSTYYLTDETAPKAIYGAYPDAKLLVGLRNPVDRAWSKYWMMKNHRKLFDGTFEEALEAFPRILIEPGFYARNLKRYLDLFPREQMHVVWFEDIKNDAIGTVKGVYAFLGVDETFVPEAANAKSHASRTTKSLGLQKALGKTSDAFAAVGLGGVPKMLRRAGLQKVVTKMNTSSFEKPKMDPETKRRLKETYASDIAELETLLGKDLSAWRA